MVSNKGGRAFVYEGNKEPSFISQIYHIQARIRLNPES